MTTINTSNALGAKVLSYIPLNGTDGEVVSASAVTLGPAGSYINDPTYGMVLHGDGSGVAATVPIDVGTGNGITICFSLAATATSGTGIFSMAPGGIGGGFSAYTQDGKLNFVIATTGGTIKGWSGYLDGGRRHFAAHLPAQGGTVVHFINGARFFGAPDLATGYNNGSSAVFRDGTLSLDQFNGTMQNFTIFEGLLTDAEVTSFYGNQAQILQASAVAPTVAAPSIVGTPTVGVASSYTPGAVTGSPTPTVTQQWTLDGVDISGATGATYTPVSGDATKALRVRQIAANTQGSANATSASATVAATQSGGSATPTSSTINIKTVGAGRDFPGVAEVDDYIRTLDCVALGKMTVIYVYDNLNVTGRLFAPATHNENAYVVMYPAPGQGVNEGLTDAYTGNWGSTGITLTATNDAFTVGRGMSVQGFRFRGTMGTGSEVLRFGPGRNSGTDAEFAYNRVWITSGTKAIFSSQYNALCRCHDNYFLFDGAYTGNVWETYGQVDVQRNTFVRKNGGAYSGNLLYGANNTFRDNVVLGFGNNILNSAGSYNIRSNNYVDFPQATADAAIIVGTTSALVVSLDDVRPAVGSPIIGGGSSAAISINDLRGGNRGPTPDAGAFQRTAATPLVVATVTSQVIDGQSLIISGTTANSPSSSLLTLAPSSVPNGAQFYGPLTVTLGSGTFAITVDDIATGSYVPSMSMTNSGGTSMVIGLAGFEIMGVESAAQDPVNAGPATAFTWIPPTAGTAGVQSAPFPVGVDGTLSATVRFTPSDNGAGGTFTPTFLDLTPTTPSGTMRYLRPTVGSSTLTGTGSGLLNPPAVTYAAAPAQTAPAPTISMATADAAVMAGKRATISGAVNLQGDATGHVDVFLDPQSSGTPVSLGAANVTSGTWTKQADIPPGLYRLRAVATGNGQTTSASTGDIRVLNLTGNFTLPTA